MERGEQLSTEWEARIAVEIASEKLAGIPRQKKRAWLSAVVGLVAGVQFLVFGQPLFAAAFFLIAVLSVVLLRPLITRVVEPRLERARQLNAELLPRSDQTP